MILIDLFSGLGGMHLGAQMAGLEFSTTYFSEIDPYATSIYKQNFPRSIPLGDIREIDGGEIRRRHPKAKIVVTAGWPCQDLSSAGSREGLDGDRSGLWVEAMRLIGDLRPAAVLLENVPAVCSAGLERILLALADLGMDAEWEVVSAASLGAPHLRERLWVVAYPRRDLLQAEAGPREEEAPDMGADLRADREAEGDHPWPERASACATGTLHGRSALLRVDDGLPAELDEIAQRSRCLGNAVVPQVVERIFRRIIRAGLLPVEAPEAPRRGSTYRVKPPFSYVGGKAKLAPWFISRFPPHETFVEVCGGSGAVLFAKDPSSSRVEVYNDIDENVTNFFRTLRDPSKCERLVGMLDLTPYGRGEHDDLCREILERAGEWEDSVEWARAFYVGIVGSYNACLGNTFSTTPDPGKNRARIFRSYRERFAPLCERLSAVVIENRPAEKIVGQYSTPDSFLFLDPPYVHRTRGKLDAYLHEMDDEAHVRLVESLLRSSAKVMLCGYPNDIYDSMLSAWRREERPHTATTGGRTAKATAEVLWTNF